MEFLFKYTKWSNVELMMFKICLACAGIVIGIYFYDELKPFLPHFTMLFFSFAIWIVIIWLRKLKASA